MMSSRRERSVRGETASPAATGSTGEEAAALASAGVTDTPVDGAGRPAADTSHLTMPAVPMTPGYASDGTGRILDDAVREEARVRRAYLTHPNPPDDMPTGLKNADGSEQTAGDLRRAVQDEREATRVRETLVPTETTAEVVGEANPTGDGDERKVSIVASTTVPKLDPAASGDEGGFVRAAADDGPPVITGATVNTRTDAHEPVVMRSGDSLDSPANTAVRGVGSTSALDSFGNTPPGGRNLTGAEGESGETAGAGSPAPSTGDAGTSGFTSGTVTGNAGVATGSTASGGAGGTGTTGIGDGTSAGTPGGSTGPAGGTGSV